MNRIAIAKEPFLSVIIPVYNVERYIHDCIESVLGQTHKNIEVILVDDGSTDSCGTICDEYAERDARIVVVHKANQGLGPARNSGLAHARGKYVTFIDSDDVIDKNAYELLLGSVDNAGADAVYFSSERFKNIVEISEIHDMGQPVYITGRCNVDAFMLDMIANAPDKKRDRDIYVSSCMAIYRRALIEEYKLEFFSEREIVSEDLVFNLFYLQRCKVILYTNAPFYKYRITEGSLTTTHSEEKFALYISLHKFLLEWGSQMTFFQILKNRVERMTIGHFRHGLKVFCAEYRKMHSLRETEECLSKIIVNSSISYIIKDYPVLRLPLKHMLFAYFIKAGYKRFAAFLILFS